MFYCLQLIYHMVPYTDPGSQGISELNVALVLFVCVGK